MGTHLVFEGQLMMRAWVWLLPGLVWKYFFAHFPRQQVRLEGNTRFLLRLDDEFVLVYDPQVARPAECTGQRP
jgi:hypothetical protein